MIFIIYQITYSAIKPVDIFPDFISNIFFCYALNIVYNVFCHRNIILICYLSCQAGILLCLLTDVGVCQYYYSMDFNEQVTLQDEKGAITLPLINLLRILLVKQMPLMLEYQQSTGESDIAGFYDWMREKLGMK